MPNITLRIPALLIVLLLGASRANAAVTLFWGDPAPWQSAAGPYTTIGFADLPGSTIVTTQYLDQGVLFTDGNDVVVKGWTSYPTDGAGINGGQSIHLQFTQPMNWLAVDYPGGLTIQLFSGGQSIYTSGIIPPGSGLGNFAGIVSTQSFDSVVLKSWLSGDTVVIDNLHFGAPIPAPGILAMMAVALHAMPGRRRRSRPHSHPKPPAGVAAPRPG